MSKAESTRSILENHDIFFEELERELLNYWIEKCRKDAQEHTNATLDELEEKVEGIVPTSPMGDGKIQKEKVLQLIDEVRNE